VQPLRWQADAALTGVDTVLADDPCSPTAAACAAAARCCASSSTPPCACRSIARWSDGAKRCRHLHRLHDEARIRELTKRGVRVEVLPAEAGRVPLDKVLDKLGEEGILTLLTETGTRLNTALLAAGLVDRVHLFVSPQIMGSDAVPAFRGMAHAIRMAEVEVERYGNDLGLCSLLKDPWPLFNSSRPGLQRAASRGQSESAE
jgi:diaminohydroxyphosphoribosylaminopyrimidine deaminase / 5-amino-6-(5-phosphoribosylamino)uracil reductase